MQETQARAIDGKVAKILNSRELVINRGTEHGVKEGMRFEVIEELEEVLDPDTKVSIGTISRVKIRVKVAHVQSRLSIARTYETYVVPDSPLTAAFALSSLVAQNVTKVKTIASASEGYSGTPYEEGKSFIQIGDKVVQILED